MNWPWHWHGCIRSGYGEYCCCGHCCERHRIGKLQSFARFNLPRCHAKWNRARQAVCVWKSLSQEHTFVCMLRTSSSSSVYYSSQFSFIISLYSCFVRPNAVLRLLQKFSIHFIPFASPIASDRRLDDSLNEIERIIWIGFCFDGEKWRRCALFDWRRKWWR